MTEQLVEEQATSLDKAPNSQLKLYHESKTAILTVTEASPSSLSPEMMARPADSEIPPLLLPDTINVAKTTHDQAQLAKKVTTQLFDPKYTSQPRKFKKRKDYTVDDYNSEHGMLSFDQHWSKVMQATLSTKQGSALDMAPGQLTTAANPTGQNVDSSGLQLQSLYDGISQVIIDELVVNIQVSAEGDICPVDNRYAVRRVAGMIETFITHNRARLMSIEKAETTIAPPDDDDKALINPSRLAQLAGRRSKVAQTLSLNNPECYSSIIPIDIVDRLKVGPGRCIADKGSWKKGEESRCKIKKSISSGAARQSLQELADLPKPREFSRVAKLLADVIANAICERHHRIKARDGLEKLCRHFSPDDKQKLEQKIEVTQLERWISQLVEPLMSHDLVHCDGVEPKSNNRAEDACCEKPNKSTVQDLEQSSSAPALLVFNEKAPSQNAQGYEVAAFPHDGKLTVRHFTPYTGWNRNHRDLLPERLVETIAKSQLTDGDIARKGKVYIFWHVGNFQWVKIGYTKKSTKNRIAEWKAQCGFDASEHATTVSFGDQVSHPYRVERLVHAELKNERFMIIECQGCGKSHDEWFRVGASHAQAVVKKWTEWMQQSDPYDEKGNFKTGIDFECPPVGEQSAKVISKPARRQKSSLHSKGQAPRRSSRIAAQGTGQQSKQNC